ncbi:oxidoreductase [Aquiflexum sp. LQ15W]|uniref:oxidoreductase n=1 Tax=Cognataquiflexum nitidum TaxID=2922272 RepID=UPI001F139585|nr:oxidoreductase [Cognataquiflexum nitidum]MCH6199532.1 oxidoreductase [Cognataquiflexum nitidum]
MTNQKWTANDIPNQTGKTIIITGATSGIGLEAAKILAAKGAKLILPVRNAEKGKNAVKEIKQRFPDADIAVMPLDISDLDSVRQFAEKVKTKYSKLDLLMNNAGIMWTPQRMLSKQGNEMQFATNHLGHFILTGLLLSLIKATPNSRIVTQSSVLHKKTQGQDFEPQIQFEDLNFTKSYDTKKVYAQSKLANLLFTYELDRRLKQSDIKAIATASHPGYTATNLQKDAGFMMKIMNVVLAQKVDMGVLPILRAAIEPDLKGGEFYGPTKMNEMKGYPELVSSSDTSYDKELARKLWEVSENLVDFKYDF